MRRLDLKAPSCERADAKSAKALGRDVPPTLFARADEMIEQSLSAALR